MPRVHRRSFLQSAFMSAAAMSLSPRSWGQVKGANERIHTATVGFNGRGRSHISGMLNLEKYGVRVSALCDVDGGVRNTGKEMFERRNQPVKLYTDIRELLEDKDLDVVTIATPNHWHSLAAIWAIQAGKDVYVEKPVSHNVWEGRKVVEAARKYGRIVQTGTQGRSSTAIRDAVEYVRAGKMGKVLVSRGLCYKRRASIGQVDGPQKVPDNLDYNLWSGPAPLVPPHRNSNKGPIHYDWHWIWNYGNGDLGNQGIHQMDIARWFLGVDHLSPRVFSVGGRLGYEDDGETPNTQIIYHDFDDAPLIFEVRGLTAGTDKKDMDEYQGVSIGNVVECEGGRVVVSNRYGSAQALDRKGKVVQEFTGNVDHFENFIQAVRSRKSQDLHADIWEGHLSSALCHTGNISHRVGAASDPNVIRESIKGNRDALPTYERMAEHLAANGVNIEKSRLTLGPVLHMDPKTETFFGHQQANALLRREYRKPFVVPEHV